MRVEANQLVAVDLPEFTVTDIVQEKLRSMLSVGGAEFIDEQGYLCEDIKYHNWETIQLCPATDLDKAIFQILDEL